MRHPRDMMATERKASASTHMLPHSLASALRLQVLAARTQWEADRQARRGGVETPHALEQKYP